MKPERTTVYLSRTAKRMIKKNIKNFSQWVEEKIITEFGSEMSASALTEAIMEHERELAQLREMRSAMEGEEAKVNSFVENMASAIKDTSRNIKNAQSALNVFGLVIRDDPILSGISKEELVNRINSKLSKEDVPGYR